MQHIFYLFFFALYYVKLAYYDYSVSMSSHIFITDEDIDIKTVIKAADAKMYENKLKYLESKQKPIN